MKEWYFEDIPLNQPLTTNEYLVTQEELIAFARKWDPLPIHTDPEAAEASPHGGLIASSTHTYAIASALGHQMAARPIIIAGNETKSRYLQPVRPGDRLAATSECVHKRESHTKADRGIARFVVTLRNQKGETVLEMESTLVVPRREPK